MRILSITAQKPHSTGSGVYLTETVRGFKELGHTQAVIAGVTREDSVKLPEGVGFYPVYYNSPELPFPVCGMSDEGTHRKSMASSCALVTPISRLRLSAVLRFTAGSPVEP